MSIFETILFAFFALAGLTAVASIFCSLFRAVELLEAILHELRKRDR